MNGYAAADEYIEGIQRFTDKHDLAYIRCLMERMEIDDSQFKIVHVAGTNGKGSVCIYLESMMLSAGKKVGCFTSPHLISLCERIRINGIDIDEDSFVSSYERVSAAVTAFVQEGNQHPSFFEFVFFIAMDAFSHAGVDWIILETGLGGRLDTTNVIIRPVCCVIASISLDHTFFLGDTIEKIASEKAGILKEGVPIVYLDNDPAASAVIARRATELHCRQIRVRADDCVILKNTGRYIDFSIPAMYDANHTFRVNTSGSYQPMNALLALHAAEIAMRADPAEASDRKSLYEVYRSGLNAARWPARMQEILPGVYLDGGHNPEGTASFLDSLHVLEDNNCIKGQRHLLYAVSDDKDYESMIRRLSREAGLDTITAARFASSRSVEPMQLKELFCKYTKAPVYTAYNAAEAFDEIMRRKRPEDTVFVLGSLYLAGEILRHLKGGIS